ncbi:MAG: hypothetical protein H6551_04530 [Chitinophagales bacterium]|nr:hypothetical protein [Chitinophagales bacterium]
MIKNLIIDFSPVVLVALFVLFSVIKVSIISIELNKNYFSLFLNSFLFFNKVTIKNTFHERLKNFYRKSNKINTIFYVLFAIVIAMYILMKAIK